MTATFDYHVLCRDEVVDRATREHIARRVCFEGNGVFDQALHNIGFRIIHVPTGVEVARYHNTVEQEPLNCAHCGRARPWHRRGKHYCSDECEVEGNGLFCVGCGVPTGPSKRCRSCARKSREIA